MTDLRALCDRYEAAIARRDRVISRLLDESTDMQAVLEGRVRVLEEALRGLVEDVENFGSPRHHRDALEAARNALSGGKG